LTGSAKTFKYTTPPLKSTPTHLLSTPLLSSKAIHFFATAEEIMTQVPALLSMREQNGITSQPLIIWEPFPASCKSENLDAITQACQHVDVFSPNHLEFLALFDDANTSSFDKTGMEKRALFFANRAKAEVVIIRCAEKGCLTISGGDKPLWLPPHYLYGAKEVVDPTGAGNAFLGGFTAGWIKTGDAKEASVYGSVASSFAIEQIGLPKLKGDGDGEIWNGLRVAERVEKYKESLIG
jgi:sugar/nucleoside kinase (ribokinase family)